MKLSSYLSARGRALVAMVGATACISGAWAAPMGAWGVADPEAARPPQQLLAVAKRAHYVIRGGYAAAGVDMRNKGFGTITIAGIPENSKVIRAFLYWDILNSGLTAAMSKGSFNGKPITGAVVGSGGDPCWRQAANFAFRADVTSLVAGDGSYALSGFASGDTSGTFPWNSTPVPPLAEGATLVVIYSNVRSPAVDITLVEGSDLVVGPYSLTVDGFLASDPVAFARYTSFGADGQSVGSNAAGERISFNGTQISTNDWDGLDGPNQLWDTRTHDVTALVPAGATSVTISYAGNAADCWVWNGAIIAVSAGDTDGDGLPDSWERNGYDHDGDGVIDVDLPGMGADYRHKDVFVEVDYMVAGDHSHLPNADAINRVVAAYDKAPVPNPSGRKGIKPHVDYGQGGLFTGGNSLAHQDPLAGAGIGDFTAFDQIKAANFAEARRPIFHYAVFAHSILNSRNEAISGISKGIPGSDFIVSLGPFTDQVGTEEEQAGTFMHELGHNMNLRHGGDDNVNYKPNFLSVMNYHFQFVGLRRFGFYGNFDYSRYLLPTLDETSLDETVGLNSGVPFWFYGTKYRCNGVERSVLLADRAIDWNCNGSRDEVGVAQDINEDPNQAPALGLLTSFLDWDNFDFRGGGTIGTPTLQAAPSRVEIPEELPVKAYLKTPPPPPSSLVVRSVNGATLVSWSPVGLQVIRSYRIYDISTGRPRQVATVAASADGEKARRTLSHTMAQASAAARYAVSAIDAYGNESEKVEVER